MRTFIAIAAFAAIAQAQWDEKTVSWDKDTQDAIDGTMGATEGMGSTWDGGDWDKKHDMDMDGHHEKHNDWDDIECMMGSCDSAAALTATTAAFAMTVAALM